VRPVERVLGEDGLVSGLEHEEAAVAFPRYAVDGGGVADDVSKDSRARKPLVMVDRYAKFSADNLSDGASCGERQVAGNSLPVAGRRDGREKTAG
jgi:hypothetical protein